ncbi:LysR family transcriptional regulator [Arthrobacter sp. MMS24-S77]
MSHDVTLVQLHYFQVVAKHGSMTRAADELNVTQSTLSSAVARLEAAYGIELFLRIPRRGVALSPAGRRLLSSARQVLDTTEHLREIARGESDEVRGEVSIGIHAPLAPFYSPAILQAAALKHPELKIHIVEGDMWSLPEDLSHGRIELALMYERQLEGSFAFDAICEIHPHIVVSQDHRLALRAGSPVSLAELVDEPLVVLSSPFSYSVYLGYFTALGLNPRILHTSQSYETIRSYVANNLGYSILHHRHLTYETHTGKRIVPLEIKDPTRPMKLCLVSLNPTQLSNKARAVSDIARAAVLEQFASEPGVA